MMAFHQRALVLAIPGANRTAPTIPQPTTYVPARAPPVVPAAPKPNRGRLMITNGVSARELKRLTDHAAALVGNLENSGSGGQGWRDVNWTAIRVKRGDCARLGAGGLRRSFRIPILEQRRRERVGTQGMGVVRHRQH